MISRCQTEAAKSATPSCAKKHQLVRDHVAAEQILVSQTTDGVARCMALKQLNDKKKGFLRAHANEQFVTSALRAPRDDTTRVEGILPLNINGTLTFDAAEWEIAFRNLYDTLFADPDNSTNIQISRLLELREQGHIEKRIRVPLCLLRETLARGRAKCKSAPGSDGIGWSSLCSLPHRAVLKLRSLFEARLNHDPGHTGSIETWRVISVLLIPKVRVAHDPKAWRPIALTSCIQKLYLGVVIRLVEQVATPIDPAQCGFSSGRQTAEVAETTRLAIRKCSEWGLPVYALKADVMRAFDSMKHDVILRSLQEDKVPARLCHAVLQEFLECEVSISFQKCVWTGIKFHRGGRQGGVDTPSLWTRLLNLAIKRARARWRDQNLGFHFPRDDCFSDFISASPEMLNDFVLDCLLWADDMVIFGNSIGDVRRMWVILSEELVCIGLTWKPSSLELLGAGVCWEEVTHLDWAFGDISFKIGLVDKMLVLGVHIHNTGSDEAAMDYRISQGWAHFLARKRVFCSSLLPLRNRWLRMRETVFRTMLYGCGSWHFTPAMLHKLSVVERKMLRLTLHRKRGPDQEVESFERGLNSKITELMTLFGWTPLTDQALNMSVSWQGHVARMHVMSPVVLLTHWRCASFVRALGSRRPLRARSGPSVPDAVENLVGLFGPFWHLLAQDRHEWRTLKASYLDSLGCVERPIGCLWGSRFLRHISSSCRDVLRGTSMQFQVPVVHISDSMLVVRNVKGDWPVASVSEFTPFVKSLRWSLYALEFQWKFVHLSSETEILVHRLRHFNTVSDHFANNVLDADRACIEQFLCDSLPSAAASVVLSSDGASRGNPGPGSASAALHVLEHGVLRLVAHRAIQLGTVTNNIAEFEGACLAHSLLIDWSIRTGLCR